MVIDLHNMNRNDAIRFFIEKYNDAVGSGYRDEIIVIHGYGSSGKGGIIKKEFRDFLKKHKEYMDFMVDVNPGTTLVIPMKKVNQLQDLISTEVMDYCRAAPRSMDKIKGNFFKKYTNAEINSCVKKLVKQGLIIRILKKNGDVYQTKGE